MRSILRGESWDEKKFRHADIVLIDDLQFIADKVATQDELSRLISKLCDRDQQVILACDLPLKEFPALRYRMRTRRRPTVWTVAIHPPDRKLRKKLIRKKTKAIGLTISDETAADILEKASNSRQIDGLLNELKLQRIMSQTSKDMQKNGENQIS